MPTVTEWQQALSREYQLNIESTPELCNDIWNRQQLRDRERSGSGRQPSASKNLIPWPPSGRRETVLIRPVELLHHLGQITTPPVTELVDLSSTWAEIRYVWAFRPNFDGRFRRALRLNNAVKQLDFHQKTLLSDEFGVAFAAYYMDRFEQATDPVDTFIARRQGQFGLRGNSRRSLPDYIFTGPGVDQYFVVECKGTQSSRSTAIAQLQRGSEQVMTVDIDPPATVTRLVIGAWLRSSISVLLIDPDDDGGEVRKLSHWSPEEVTRFAAAKRLTYIGDNLGAARVISDFISQKAREEQPVFERARLTITETDLGDFVGSAQPRMTPDGHRLELFRGIQRRSLDRLYHAPVLPKQLERSRDVPQGGGSLVETGADNVGAFVRSFTRDGSLFQVRIVE